MGETCKTCRFYRDGHSNWDHSGECRRYPPTAVEHPRGGIQTVFAKTIRSEWCGEYAATPTPSTSTADVGGGE